MALTPEELKLGWNAYQGVRHYEKYGVRNSRQARWIFALCGVALIVISYYDKDYGLVTVFLVPIWFLLNFAQDRIARSRYADFKLILQLLKEKYGESLPWLEEEKQLSAANELVAEIARAQRPLSM